MDAALEIMAREVWQPTLRALEIHDLGLLDTGDGLVALTRPASAVGRFGVCRVDAPISPASIDRAIEQAACAAWFESPYI